VSSTPATTSQPECALIVPVYRNEENIDALVARLHALHRVIPGGIEAVCVVDGSPDASYTRLTELLPGRAFRSRVCCYRGILGHLQPFAQGSRQLIPSITR
jgi:glycosyltransferase involved in cell wall biosynthesis